MTIYPPKIEIIDDKAVVSSIYESNNVNNKLWFSFDREYKDYIVTENTDAFVIGLLLLAMKNNEDIEVCGKISARLYYQLNHYIIRAINLANNELNKIKVNTKEVNDQNLCYETVAGTGISCGIDSFATILDHLYEKENFQIKFFTFFNAGSHGEFGGENARNIFEERLRLVSPYVETLHKKIVMIDTNLNECLMMKHIQTHTIRDVACILNLQKLFKYYYYASAYRFDIFALDKESMAKFDLLLLSQLSTESTTFYSSVSQFTRVERTEFVVNYEPSYKYLNVCVSSSISKKVENCSQCSKCLRTQLTLELIGKLNLYTSVFNLEKYYQVKDKFIGKIMSQRKYDIYSREIYKLIKKKNYSISPKSYLYSIIYKIKSLLRG